MGLQLRTKMELPDERDGVIIKFDVSGWEGYLRVSEVGGNPVEVFIVCSKVGSTVRGFLDAMAVSMSIGLRAGVPLKTFLLSMKGMTFEPNGYAILGKGESERVSSIVDAVVILLARRYYPSIQWEDEGKKSHYAEVPDLSSLSVKSADADTLCDICSDMFSWHEAPFNEAPQIRLLCDHTFVSI